MMLDNNMSCLKNIFNIEDAKFSFDNLVSKMRIKKKKIIIRMYFIKKYATKDIK